MLKIGIFTFYNNYNYGSYLQAFALRSKICGMGYDAYVIDFTDYSKKWNNRLRYKTILNRLLCSIKRPSLFVEAINAKKVGIQSTLCDDEMRRQFDAFSDEHLRLYKDDYTAEGIFSAFVVGSDQVWKMTLPGLHYVLFLRFAKPIQRISYAASLGGSIVPSYNRSMLKKYVKSFSSVSVREDSSVKMLAELDSSIQPEFVLDPVLLVGKEFWDEQLSICPKEHDNYVLLYFLDNISHDRDIFYEVIKQYAKTNILMVNTGIPVPANISAQIVTPGPIEFVNLIKNAKAVLTDSFHGSAFSVLYNKDFYTFPRNYKMYSGQKDRLYSLLKLFDCQDRYMDGTASVPDVRALNDNLITSKMTEMQISSKCYLQEAINKSIKAN